MSDRYNRAQSYVPAEDFDDTVTKMQQKYWRTKHAVFQKLGKKEDECITSSDAELDSKLELFYSIQISCKNFLKLIEIYQERICSTSQAENNFGRFLKERGKHDKTRAGKMMEDMGKTICFNAQQRIMLRESLHRLRQEVETFHGRAVSDTLETIAQMESARAEFRGCLHWMKTLPVNPDDFKEMDKYKKVQLRVKRTQSRFAKLKLDTLQKTDLLSVSRCNMLSLPLSQYQDRLIGFWERTARCLTAVASLYAGPQPYQVPGLPLPTTPTEVPRDIYETLFFEADYHDEDASAPKDGKRKKKEKNEPEKEKQEEDNILDKGEATGILLELDSELQSSDNFLGLDDNSATGEDPLKDIFGESTFDQEWIAHFGNDESTTETLPSTGGLFLPSQLLASLPTSPSLIDTAPTVPTPPSGDNNNKLAETKDAFHMEEWVKMFDEMDPLSNSGALFGLQSKGEEDRAC